MGECEGMHSATRPEERREDMEEMEKEVGVEAEPMAPKMEGSAWRRGSEGRAEGREASRSVPALIQT